MHPDKYMLAPTTPRVQLEWVIVGGGIARWTSIDRPLL
jgi:hypothetical protein